MRLTVGPLPAGVYWRRRAAVLAVLALLIVLVAVSCNNGDPSTTNGQSPPGSSPTVGGPSESAGPSTTATGTPGGTDPSSGTGTGASPSSTAGVEPDPGGTGGTATGGEGTGGNGGNGGDDGVDDGGTKGNPGVPVGPPPTPCTDAELSLTAEISPSPGVYGGVVVLTLIVRNTSARACTRDVGSAAQELRVLATSGANQVWSSDSCGTPRASDVRTFGPNIESRFSLQWNTYRVAPNECQTTNPPAAPGNYQVVARLDTKVSDPVAFQIRQ